MITAIVIIAIVGVLAAAPAIGAESRPGFDERPESARFAPLP